MNEHDLDLIQKEVDGLTTDAENERLESLLAADPELRLAYDELQAVKSAFSAYVEKEPPPGLKRAIMSALPAPALASQTQASPSSASTARSFWAALTDRILTPRPVMLAYSFALGIIVAFAVSTVLIPVGGGMDPGDVAGTIGGTTGSPAIETTDYSFSADGVSGRVVIGESIGSFTVEFVWESDHPVQARITFDDATTTIVRTENVSRARIERSNIAPGSYDFVGAGSIEEAVVFESSEAGVSVIDITILSGSEVVFDLFGSNLSDTGE